MVTVREQSAPARRRALATFAVALAVFIAATIADRREATIRLSLQCEADSCSAMIDGGAPLELTSPGLGDGAKLGLYIFNQSESASDQYFRDVVITSADARSSLALDSTRDLAQIDAGARWKVRPGIGLTLPTTQREAAIAMLRSHRSADFNLALSLVSPSDAGVLVRASDENNGLMFVVRPTFNDAFFCKRRNGRAGPILALTPLRELTASREGLRLAGLVAEIVLWSIAWIAILRLIISRFAGVGPPRPASTRVFRRQRPPFWLLPTLAVATVLALAAVAIVGLGRMPHVEDEVAYLFQAKIFAGGRLWAPAPPLGDFFLHEHLIMLGDRWFGKYPPLFPAILALGARGGVPWLVNPVLGALTAFVTYLLARELSDWRWGVVAWMLTVSSPFFLLIGGSMMSHMTAALLVTLALLLTIRATTRKSCGIAALSGLCLGLMLLARPYTALLATLILGVYYAAQLAFAGSRQEVLRRGLIVAFCIAPFAALFLGWNLLLTSPAAPTTNLYTVYNETDRMGFGPDKGSTWLMTWGSFGHSPAKALRSVHQYLESMSRYLLGWPGRLSFALVLASVAWGRRKAGFWLLSGLFVVLVLGYTIYWATQHISYGARYWFAAVPGLMVLAAIGLRWLVGDGALPDTDVSSSSAGARMPAGSACAFGVVAAMTAWNLAFSFPSQWRELEHYSGVSPELRRVVETHGLDDAIVFVRTEGLMYNDGFFMNDPLLREGPIFARDLGARNDELLRAFPGRKAYRWDKSALVPLDLSVRVAASAPRRQLELKTP